VRVTGFDGGANRTIETQMKGRLYSFTTSGRNWHLLRASLAMPRFEAIFMAVIYVTARTRHRGVSSSTELPPWSFGRHIAGLSICRRR